MDKSPINEGLKLGIHKTFRTRHGRLLDTLCTLDLHPVTTGNCHHFYYETSSTVVLECSNFGHNQSFCGKIAGITYMKIDQSYVNTSSIRA